ncbi:hypothetical protein [Sphingomonas sp. 3-13AW]|uniref:hypothetical protein n=1 Tax=Sphingomonas sp. 3-13AW TaxID=3050450 RepID=UPI003BB5A69B
MVDRDLPTSGPDNGSGQGSITVDRERDVVLLTGLPDRALAAKTLEYARDLRQGAGITERDGAVGELLNRIVPAMAHKLGVPIDDHEQRVIVEHSERMRGRGGPEQTVDDMSQTILHAVRDGSRQFRDSALFSPPEKGNLAAVMLDRMLRQEGIKQATRPDGSVEPYPGPDGTTRAVSGVVGPDAVGTHPVARRMLEKTSEMGHHPVPYWSPGHMLPPRDGGKFGKMLSPESLLEISAQQVYASRLHALSDKDLAAELVEQARDMRERRPEVAITGQGGYHRFVANYTIPEMGTLYGQTLQPGEVNPHPIRRDDDQAMFEGVSSAVFHAIPEGQHYVVRDPDADRASLSEKVMFAEPSSGNSMGMLLDRVAATLEVERGGEYDRMGRAIAEVGRFRGYGDHHYAWQPTQRSDEEVSLRKEPAKAAERTTPELSGPRKGAMAAALAAAGIGASR